MPLIDTHAHLYADAFDGERKEMIQRAFDIGVEKIYLPNVDSQSIPGMLELELQYPGRIFAMMGLHPCSVQADSYRQELEIVSQWLNKRHFVAIGEIGMDLYWDKSTQEIQEEAFRYQCELAKEHRLPIVIHSREAIDELLDIIEDQAIDGLRGIFHCFSGSAQQAERIIQNGFLLGIGGPLTYKKSELPEVLASINLQHIVLETDAPYLPPTPHRGKRNESAYVHLVAEKLAQIKQLPLEEVIGTTGENALRLFA